MKHAAKPGRQLLSSLLAVLLFTGLAVALAAEPLLIGAIVPMKSRTAGREAFGLNELGEAMRLGALLAEEQFGTLAAEAGYDLKVLVATAPDAEAASRAARRLIRSDGVAALVGGIGAGQEEALREVAEAQEIPFYSLIDTATGGCSPHMTRIGIGSGGYIRALSEWFREPGQERWHVVQADGAVWDARFSTLEAELEGTGIELERTLVAAGEPLFPAVFSRLDTVGADLVVLFLDAAAQLGFLSQYEARGTGIPLTAFPVPATQTRAFYGAALEAAPEAGAGERLALWEATLAEDGAAEINERFSSRWGTPMDPAAWSAYSTIRLVVGEAVGGMTETQAAVSRSVHVVQLHAADRSSRSASGLRALASHVAGLKPGGESCTGPTSRRNEH